MITNADAQDKRLGSFCRDQSFPHDAGHPGDLVAVSDRSRCGPLGWAQIALPFDFVDSLGEICK
jgi:hypothetical protein